MASETRIDFIKKWAKFVCEHSDKEWSLMQKELIDSQIENAERLNLSKEQIARFKTIEQ